MSLIVCVLKTKRLLTLPPAIVVLSCVLVNETLGISIPLFVAETSSCVEALGSEVPIPTCA